MLKIGSYREIDLIKDLLKAGADPYRSHFSVLESGEHVYSMLCHWSKKEHHLGVV